MTLTKNGAGALFLQTTNTYTGGTTVSNGTLELDTANGAGTGAINLGANILTVNIAGGTLPNAVNGSGAINVTETASATTTLGGSLANFTGVINLPASPGGTTAKAAITSAAVNLNSNATVNIASGGTLYLSGVAVGAANNVSGTGNSDNLGALCVDGGSTISGPVNLLGNTTIGESGSGRGAISGVISDGGSGYGIIKVGGSASTLTLAGANTYGGGTTLSAGRLNLNNASALGTGTFTIAADGCSFDNTSGADIEVGNAFALSGGSPTYAGSANNMIIDGAVTLSGANRTITVTAKTLTLDGAIGQDASSRSLTKAGKGTLTLAGANTYSGGTTVSNGTLQVGNGVSNGTLPGDVAIAANTAVLSIVVATGTTQVYGGAISGPGSFTQNGIGGTLILNGLNTFANTVNINAGALWITNGAALGTGVKTINLNNGTAGQPALHLNGTNGGLTLPAGFTLTTSLQSAPGSVINEAGSNVINGPISATTGGGDSVITVNGGFLTIASNITLAAGASSRALHLGGSSNGIVLGVIASNSGGTNFDFIKQGTGAWTLAGANTYNGTTAVNAGTLLVNGAIGAGAVTVAASAVLGGSGAINAAATVQAGGAILGGDANYSNTLAINGALNLGDGSSAVTYSSFKIAAGGNVSATALAVSGINIVNLLDASLAVGTNTLFTYGGGSVGGDNGFAGFQLGTVPSGVTAQLLDTGSAVQLAVTATATVATNAPTLARSVSDGNLNLSWPSDHIGWRLLEQTNHLPAGISLNTNDWSTVAGSAGTNQVSIPIDTTMPTEFYRMVYP